MGWLMFKWDPDVNSSLELKPLYAHNRLNPNVRIQVWVQETEQDEERRVSESERKQKPTRNTGSGDGWHSTELGKRYLCMLLTLYPLWIRLLEAGRGYSSAASHSTATPDSCSACNCESLSSCSPSPTAAAASVSTEDWNASQLPWKMVKSWFSEQAYWEVWRMELDGQGCGADREALPGETCWGSWQVH